MIFFGILDVVLYIVVGVDFYVMFLWEGGGEVIIMVLLFFVGIVDCMLFFEVGDNLIGL